MPGSPAKDQLPNAALGIGTLDQKVGPELTRLRQNGGSRRATLVLTGQCPGGDTLAATPWSRRVAAISSLPGPSTVAPLTVRTTTLRALTRNGMVNETARAVSVLPFQGR